MDYKALYEQQQQETDREHQRYLEVSEKYSNKLWEVCQELNIENDDTSQNIIKEIKQLIEENEIMKEEWIAPEDADEIHDHYHEAMRDLKAQNDKINLSNREAWARARSLEGVIENKERQIADLKQGQIKEIKTMKNKCLKSVCKLNKKIKELQKQIEELEMKADATRQVNMCYAKMVSRATADKKVQEVMKGLKVSPDCARELNALIRR